ncbi:MAG: beta-N-acetylhexosaminidase, partial [bacterium]
MNDIREYCSMNNTSRCIAIIIFTALAFSFRVYSQANEISIVPAPAEIRACDGEFSLSAETAILFDERVGDIAGYLAGFIATATGMKLETKAVSRGERSSNFIEMSIAPELENLGPEGYALSTNFGGITIQSSSPAGVFYGVQTLRQLLRAEIESKTAITDADWSVPCVEITDRPRFGWRGLMLDVARHFQTKEEVLKIIDVMALYKFNRLHLHLTDDQGWRLEIRKYPELTEIGAWRERSGREICFVPTGKAHGGFYTQADMKEIIKYAAERFITVVPEIEMPGHAQAALASVPGLSCSSRRMRVRTCWGVNPEVFCAGNDRTFEFLENVLAEVTELFPCEYIHIGGDEVPKDRWRKCPKCQARIRAENLKDEDELQSWFIRK